MVGGSPALVHHHAGRLEAKACKAVEPFSLIRSARKITALLPLQQAQQANLISSL
jgi:hypothetical protein